MVGLCKCLLVIFTSCLFILFAWCASCSSYFCIASYHLKIIKFHPKWLEKLLLWIELSGLGLLYLVNLVICGFLYLILCHCLMKSLSWLTIYYTCELWTFTWHDDVITLETLALSRGFKFSKEHCLEDRLTCSVILNSFVIILFMNKKLCSIWMIYAI